MLVYAVVDDSLSPTSPLGDAVDAFIQREEAEGFIAEVRGDESGANPQGAYDSSPSVVMRRWARRRGLSRRRSRVRVPSLPLLKCL